MKRSPLTVTVLTDTHLYSLKNGFEGKAYDRANSKSQILLAESGEVLDAAFAQISADKRSDIVLICGDLTSNGDLESHKEMIAKLRRLKESGKRVYVITATHDFRKNGVTSAYRGDEKSMCPPLPAICSLICTANSDRMKQFPFTARACHMLFS